MDDKFQKLLQSVQKFPDQAEQLWNEAKTLHLDKSYSDIDHVIVAGMGGSALGARVLKSLMNSRLRTSFEIVTDYTIPSYANDKTLIILSSYSGSTEETLAVAALASTRQTKIIAITTGGGLQEFCSLHNFPIIKIDPRNNPSGMPRLANGYNLAAILAILTRLSVISFTDEELEEALANTRKIISDFSPQNHSNPAKSLAESLIGKFPVLVASQHLTGSAHVVKNQLNESAKTMSVLFEIPELNHHLLEALAHPPQNKTLLKFLFFESDHYSDRIKKRYQLTKDVLDKNNIQHVSYQITSKDMTSEAFEVIALGGFLQYYLALNYKVDPLEIPWVDYFKEKLK
jgi:glucose/mannose-6-phosphate isomerase